MTDASLPQSLLTRSPHFPSIEMRQVVGDPVCFRPHSHDELAIGVIDSGTSTYQYRRAVETIGPGVAVTINAGETHSCNPERSAWSYRMLFLDPVWTGTLMDQPTPEFPGYHIQNASALRAFDRAWALLVRADDPLETETALHDFLAPHLPAPTGSRRARRSGTDRAVIQAREMLLDNVTESVPLEVLGKAVGLTRSQLLHRFRQVWGQPPHACLIDERIKRSKALLRRGEHSLSDIAQSLGFADQAHFQRHFRQRVAMTPGQYRSSFQTGHA